jgi:hypothetical protein
MSTTTTTPNPLTMTPTDFCEHFAACHDGAEFATKYDTMAEVWDNCPRGDWLLWMLRKLRITPERELRLFACWCAEQAQPTDPRSLTAIAVSRRYAMGEATLSELQAAAEAAYAAYAAYAASEAAYAAYAADAACAVDAAYAAYAAADAAANAAYAAADAAAYASAYAAARAAAAADVAARQAQASHFRTLVKNPFL